MSRFLSLVCGVGLLAICLITCSSKSRDTCISGVQRFCTEGILYLADSCGNLEEVERHCQEGCKPDASGCIGDPDCISHAAVACKDGLSYWVNSCGYYEETIKQCAEGCRPDGRGCMEDVVEEGIPPAPDGPRRLVQYYRPGYGDVIFDETLGVFVAGCYTELGIGGEPSQTICSARGYDLAGNQRFDVPLDEFDDYTVRLLDDMLVVFCFPEDYDGPSVVKGFGLDGANVLALQPGKRCSNIARGPDFFYLSCADELLGIRVDGSQVFSQPLGGGKALHGLTSGEVLVEHLGAYETKVYRPDGTIRWTYPHEAHIARVRASEEAGKVYFIEDDLGSYRTYVGALSLADGTEQWRETISGWNVTNSTLITDTGEIYVGSNGGQGLVTGYRPDGSLIFQVEVDDEIVEDMDMLPGVGAMLVIGGNASGATSYFTAVTPTGQASWKTQVWNSHNTNPHVLMPAADQGMYYDDGVIYGIAFSNGTELWEAPSNAVDNRTRFLGKVGSQVYVWADALMVFETDCPVGCHEMVCIPGDKECQGESSAVTCDAGGTAYVVTGVCAENEQCVSGSCQACESHDRMGCHDGHPTWFDSCANAEEQTETCAAEEKCSGGECVPDSPSCELKCGYSRGFGEATVYLDCGTDAFCTEIDVVGPSIDRNPWGHCDVQYHSFFGSIQALECSSGDFYIDCNFSFSSSGGAISGMSCNATDNVLTESCSSFQPSCN